MEGGDGGTFLTVHDICQTQKLLRKQETNPDEIDGLGRTVLIHASAQVGENGNTIFWWRLPEAPSGKNRKRVGKTEEEECFAQATRKKAPSRLQSTLLLPSYAAQDYLQVTLTSYVPPRPTGACGSGSSPSFGWSRREFRAVHGEMTTSHFSVR